MQMYISPSDLTTVLNRVAPEVKLAKVQEEERDD